MSKSKSCKGNVISIDTPWKTICSEESGVAGLVLSDATLKQLAGTTFTDVNEKVQLPYSLIIESEKILLLEYWGQEIVHQIQ